VISRLIRLILRMAILAALVWAVRAALKSRDVDSGDGWAPAAPAPTSAAEAMAETPSPAAVPLSGGNGPWVAPDSGGGAPASHPVKAKVASKLYRVPGMADYDRVRADRCYESVEAAEADGFSRARR
jgi:hypothetical protein